MSKNWHWAVFTAQPSNNGDTPKQWLHHSGQILCSLSKLIIITVSVGDIISITQSAPGAIASCYRMNKIYQWYFLWQNTDSLTILHCLELLVQANCVLSQRNWVFSQSVIAGIKPAPYRKIKSAYRIIGPKNEVTRHPNDSVCDKKQKIRIIVYILLEILSQFSSDRQRKGDPTDRDDPRL